MKVIRETETVPDGLSVTFTPFAAYYRYKLGDRRWKKRVPKDQLSPMERRRYDTQMAIEEAEIQLQRRA